MEIKGLDKAMRKLNDLQKRAERLGGSHNVPIEELLTPSFMRRHTNFETLDSMMSASGFKVETTEDFESIPDDKWNAFIAGATQFSDWQEMLNEAGKEWATKQLGL